ncbi:MAG: O-antigen ligase family protein [Planctomycetales bacterium]|nr:O-antigen ligase family protein [Planctomycetales bacterium]
MNTQVTEFYSQAGLYAKLMTFMSEADPLLLAGAFFGLVVVIGLALFRRWAILFGLMLFGASFSGSVWPSLDSAGALTRWLMIILIALGVFFTRTNPGKPLTLFGLYVATSLSMCVFAIHPIFSLQQGAILAALFFASLTLADAMQTRDDVARMCTAYIVAGVCWGVMGALSLQQLASGVEGGERFSGSNVSPGVFVQTGGLFLPFVLWGVLRKWNMVFRAVCLGVFVVMVLTLISSGQRGGTFAGLAGCAPLMFRSQMGKVSLAFGAVGLAALVVYKSAGVNRAQTEFVMSRFFSTSTSNRTEIWADALKVCMESPILGKGPGSSRQEREKIVRGRTFHNMFLMVWHDAGLPGLIFFATAIGFGFLAAFKLVLIKGDPEIAEYGRLMLGIMGATLLNGMVSTGASSPSDLSTITLVVTLAMTIRLHRIHDADALQKRLTRARRMYLQWWRSQFASPAQGTTRAAAHA